MTKEVSTISRLISKSIEAFILSIELYNKPTVKNRAEGYTIFVCNAWELMLKAHLIKKSGLGSIYYPDNPNRTISLENTIQKTMTNENDPVRQNLEQVVRLRNTSTHFITEDYAILYSTLFQACATNFDEAIRKYHEVNLSEYFPQSLLYLSPVQGDLNRDKLKGKYDNATYNKMLELNDNINMSTEIDNPKYAARVIYELVQVKDPKLATISFAFDKASENLGVVISRDVDPLKRCYLTQKKCIEKVNTKIDRLDITVDFRTSKMREYRSENQPIFNTYTFQKFIDAFNIKNDPKYCYRNETQTPATYTYSMQLVEAIVDAIKTNPDKLILNLEKIIEEKR